MTLLNSGEREVDEGIMVHLNRLVHAAWPKKPLVTAMVAIAVAVGFASAPVAALAHPLDGSDPANGCAYQNTWVVSSFYSATGAGHPDGNLELVYSNGCQVAWARFVCKAGCDAPANIYIERSSNSVDGYLRYDQTAYQSSWDGFAAYAWTLQVYDGVNDYARACFFNGWECTSWF